MKDNVESREEGDGSDVQSAEEADTAWDDSGVPASLHATTQHKERSRRRVALGGLGWLNRVRTMARRLVACKRYIRTTTRGTTAP